ncbi:MAG: hypothetical protein IJ523_02005 [Succinivibrionaceae bacterium]|nr:hypothetical protein [Succinivibrionaceae bacterium]
MIITKTINKDTPLTAEQIAMLEALKTREPEPDEDCPEITPEMLKNMVIVTREERERNKKRNQAQTS